MRADFYKAFEDKFRGSSDLIKSRIQIYLSIIRPLKKIYPDASVIDLGCGRGEWLEILEDNGFSAQGVDLDDNMLAEPKKLGLNVHTIEALSFLQSLPDESQTVISSFHMVEHIQFSDLVSLVEESLRILKPAGYLILETPNPENIVIGTSSFYIDPTHQRPIPPELLAFLPEFYGFKNIKVLRLNESETIHNNDNINLLNVLNGVSPDYSVIAQKDADNKLLDATWVDSDTEIGLSLERLAMNYEQQGMVRFQKLEAKIQQHDEQLSQKRQSLLALSNKQDKAKQEIDELHKLNHHCLAVADGFNKETKQSIIKLSKELDKTKQEIDELHKLNHNYLTVADGLNKELKEIYSSKSWQMTLPLRKLMQWVKRFSAASLQKFSWLNRLPRSFLRSLSAQIDRLLLRQPGLKSWVKNKLYKYPRFEAKLRRFSAKSSLDLEKSKNFVQEEEPSQLSPRARIIYNRLVAAIEKRRKESI